MIYLGADHGGFHLKETLKQWLTASGKQVEDLGAHTLVPGDDYPQFAFAVAKKVSVDPQSTGILLCRSGAGMAIAANRMKGARAVNCINVDEVEHARRDNDANVLTLPADWLSAEDAKTLVDRWLSTSFSGDERHRRRISALEIAQ
jgi:ribose 5-phosphate isomerase B